VLICAASGTLKGAKASCERYAIRRAIEADARASVESFSETTMNTPKIPTLENVLAKLRKLEQTQTDPALLAIVRAELRMIESRSVSVRSTY
jgi:hypothetical protein